MKRNFSAPSERSSGGGPDCSWYFQLVPTSGWKEWTAEEEKTKSAFLYGIVKDTHFKMTGFFVCCLNVGNLAVPLKKKTNSFAKNKFRHQFLGQSNLSALHASAWVCVQICKYRYSVWFVGRTTILHRVWVFTDRWFFSLR